MSSPTPPVTPEQQIAQAIEDSTKQQQQAAAGGFPLEVKLETGQVYRGKTPQEVLDQLVAAQTEASRTIQSRTAELEQLRTEVQTLKQQTPVPQLPATDQQAKLQQYYDTWARNPTEANKMSLAEIAGIPADEVSGIFQKMRETIIEAETNKAANIFLAIHPEFPSSDESAALMRSAMVRRYGAQGYAQASRDPDKIEATYLDLVRNGKLTPMDLPIEGQSAQHTPIPQMRGSSGAPNPRVDLMTGAYQMPLGDLENLIRDLRAQGVK